MGKNPLNAANRKLDNAMKAKGLQKLRWYCQVCEKQCRDENGFKCHTMSEGHLRQMLVVGESAGRHISDYSSRFQAEFVALLSRRWGTKRVRVNQVYQEYISDKHHLHMNATRWLSLTEFTKHLGRSGIAHVDETEKGWFIAWIDNSPKALAKADATMKKDRADMDDETRQRKLIQEQIERARKEGERRRIEAAGGTVDGDAEGDDQASKELKRDEGEKLSLSLSFKTKEPDSQSATVVGDQPASNPDVDELQPSSIPSTTLSSSSTGFIPPPKTSIGFAAKPNPLKVNPLKSNPLKKPNPLKASSSLSTSSSSTTASTTAKRPLSAVEAIVQEEMARKNRMGNQTADGDGLQKRAKYF